ncbi:MAG: hypothetical protein ACREQL_08735 [Candidatus Binatia bacterium]
MSAHLTRSSLVPTLIGVGLTVFLALHFFAPTLAITWSYAHLGRQPALPIVAGLLVVILPPLAVYFARSPGWRVAARPWSPAVVLAAVAVIAATVWVLGTQLEVFQPAADRDFYLQAVNDPTYRITRWHLTGWTVHRLAVLLAHAPLPVRRLGPVITVAFGANLAFGVIALTALAGAARALAATRGEAIAITLLTWTTFGVLQLSSGYLDVYPAALAVLSLYLWVTLRVLRGETHPAWSLGLAAVAPFWYEGLALIAPSALVVAWVVARRPGGRRTLGIALAVAIAAGGVSTLPIYGAPFAWRAFVSDLIAQSAVEFGYSRTSNLIPWEYLATATHTREVLHTLLLIDGVGMLLVLVLGPALAREVPREPELGFLAALVLPYLLYCVVMDPVYGAFADWDLFSYGAAVTSLFGGALFVRWGRLGSPAFAPLFGLALAANLVHLLARFHALQFYVDWHLLESPTHWPH